MVRCLIPASRKPPKTDAEIMAALEQSGGHRKKAADILGMYERSLLDRLARMKKAGKFDGGVSETIPEGHTVKGVSTLYNAEGEVAGQWVKTTRDEQLAKLAQETAIRELAKKIPRQAPIPAPKHGNKRLLNLYTLTDCHVGMLSWHRETGADWDLKIAEKVLTDCFLQLIAQAPEADSAVVNQGGDFLHTDGLLALTPTSGHVLDADGRYQKIVETAVRLLRTLVNAALMKHKQVTVLMQDANHDPVGGTWLRALFAALYERDKRVRVEISPLPYVALRHGKTMLAFHHGHLSKNDNLPLLMAAKFPDLWGQTLKRYCHTGHRHHVEEKEHAGMTVIQHPTLAAPDAYAARGGWLTERQATAITYHDQWGQVGRTTVIPEMVE